MIYVRAVLLPILLLATVAGADELLFGPPVGGGVVSLPFDATQSPGCMSWDGANIDTHPSNPSCVGSTPQPTQTPHTCSAGEAQQGHGAASPVCVTLPTPDGAGGAAAVATQTPYDCGAGNAQRGHDATPICVVLATPDGGDVPVATQTPHDCGAGNYQRGHNTTPICIVAPTPDGAGGGSGDVTDVGPGCATGACFTDGVTTTGSTILVWEGTSADTNEFSLLAPSANPGSDIAITFPSSSATLPGLGIANAWTNGNEFSADVAITATGEFLIDGSGRFTPNVLWSDASGVDAIQYDPTGTGVFSAIGTGTNRANDVVCTACVADTDLASAITRDAEWDTAAEINAATTDADFLTAEVDGSTTNELPVEGTGIDVSGQTVTVDTTELASPVTFGANSGALFGITFDIAGATDPSLIATADQLGMSADNFVVANGDVTFWDAVNGVKFTSSTDTLAAVGAGVLDANSVTCTGCISTTDLADGNVGPNDLADDDFGDWACFGGVCDLQTGVVGSTEAAGLDISADTNLAVTSPIVLTGDTLSLGTLTNATLPKPLIIGPTITPTATATSTATTPTPTAATATPTPKPLGLVLGPDLLVKLQAYAECLLVTDAGGEVLCWNTEAVGLFGAFIGPSELENPLIPAPGFVLDLSDAVLDLPQDTDCSGVIAEGRCCWDTDDDVLSCGSGAAARQLAGLARTQTFTGVNTFTGHVRIAAGATSTPAATPTATAATPTATAATPTPTATSTPNIHIIAPVVGIDGNVTLIGNVSRTLKVGPCTASPCVGRDLTIESGAAVGTHNFVGGTLNLVSGAGTVFGQGGPINLTVGAGGGNITLATRRGFSAGGQLVLLANNLVVTQATSGTGPTFGAGCGSTASDALATNSQGKITMSGTGQTGSCVVTFGNSGFTNAPTCNVTYQVNSDASDHGLGVAVPTTTTLTINSIVLSTGAAQNFGANDVVNYTCLGR